MSTEITKTSQVPSFNFFDPEAFAAMQKVANLFSNSELVPEIYRTSEKNPAGKAIANCVIALSMATRIGADPLMIMQNMYIVHGQPAWSAKFLTATVNACGKYKSIKYKFRELGDCKGVEYSETTWENGNKNTQTKKVATAIPNIECIAYTTEHGSEIELESIPVTVEMAIKEGWYFKNGSKWQNMAKLMLQYRAVTFWTRAYAPELSMGIKTEDEIVDTVDIPYTDVTNTVSSEIQTKGNTDLVDFKEETPIDKTQEAEKEKEQEQTSGEQTSGEEQPKEQPLKASERPFPSADIKVDNSNPPTLGDWGKK